MTLSLFGTIQYILSMPMKLCTNVKSPCIIIYYQVMDILRDILIKLSRSRVRNSNV